MADFVDIHCHILPALDDGPRSLMGSLEMMRMARADGIGVIAATPHINRVYGNTRDGIEKAISGLAGEARKTGITICPGADVRVSADLLKRLANGHLPLINNGKYLLLELPHNAAFSVLHLEGFLASLKERGIVPIITHPERNAVFMRQTGLMKKWIMAGAVFQVTACSITGSFGREVQKAAAVMLKRGFIHLAASDAHNTSTRPPVLSKAYSFVKRMMGEADAERLFITNPRGVTEGLEIR